MLVFQGFAKRCRHAIDVDDSRAGLGRETFFMVSGPLRILLGRDHLAVTHVNNPVAVFGGFGIVSNHQNGLAQFFVRLSQHAEDDIGILGIQISGRLVGEHDGGLVDQSASQGDPLLFSAAKVRMDGGSVACYAKQIA